MMTFFKNYYNRYCQNLSIEIDQARNDYIRLQNCGGDWLGLRHQEAAVL